ncbi:MAG: cfa [Patescibacteria group bacterium]|nr:cfa [Patescibacteria group bacterium]
MIEKRIIHQIFRQIHHGAMTVSYWDGTSVAYGRGEPYFQMAIKTPAAVRAILRNMTLGFCESYMNGRIDIDGPLENIGRLVSENNRAFSKLSFNRFTRLRAPNSRRRQPRQIQHHYDLGNDFYKLWLDRSMTYSCAYFHTPEDTLEAAQQQKVGHILRKLQLSPGQRLLDIGSGWGALLITAAQRYGVTGHGITLSKEQYAHSQAAAEQAGVAGQVTFELTNYQDLAEQPVEFDRIVSVGMYEHVGRHNQDNYFSAVGRLLAPGGLSVLHTITNQFETTPDPWIDKYIFPGGYIPAVREVVHKLPRHNFHLTDYENLRLHYALTLEEWLRRFERQEPAILQMYDERFCRMWRMYLASSAAGFRYGDLSLSQFTFTKGLGNDLPLTREYLYR